ncbi:ATP-dependent zinc metalloprotease FtsH [Amycolatopsis palatopharyngis]|uniref:ATP-dependent zinc metalloprotease FtsH n=1 Tax=Amycolatopsis palatopharyngis TaxID=187982 RepID=UPI000E24230C|nr:ATP-dependent zinc metalloprotease FtsH [Amycolatopsis palatopharyngis]
MSIRDLLRRNPERRARPARWLLLCLIVVLGLLVVALRYLTPSSPGRELSLSELSTLVQAQQVERVTILDEDAQIVGEGPDGTFHVAYPKSDTATAALIQQLTDAGARVDVDPQSGKATIRMLATVVLPLVLLANLFALLFTTGRQNSGGLSEVRRFGTLGRRGGPRAEPPAVTFGDVAGADEAVTELDEIVSYLTDPTRYASLGAVPPKGVLLFGPPGCGKTLVARATAGEAGVPFFSVSGADFVESLVGVGAARIRDLFARARAVAPAIVFIDEIDAAGRRRGAADGGGSDEREQTLNQLLVEMDGFDAASGVVVMGATNRPDILDPALLRPGRFDRHVVIDRPDVAGRQRILRLHTTGRPVADNVDLGELARQTPGFTGADLANVVNEAALLAIREGHIHLGRGEFTEAVQRVLSGPQRRGRVLSEDERRRIAVHESGHAIVAAGCRLSSDVHRISIVARGRGLGSITMGGDRDAVLLTQDRLHAHLTLAMSGRAAEELVFGTPSTGSESDLEHATDLARDIAGRYGMSQRLGRMRLLAPTSEVYLGGSAALERLSERVHETFDDEVRRLLDDAFHTATDTLLAHRELLDDLVAEVLRTETLEGAALDTLLDRVTPAGAILNGERS